MNQHDRDWLLSKGIPLSEVFDAAGMGRKEYGAAMRSEEKYVAINVTPCKRAGHRIRTRTGKCMACDVTQYAFSKRHRTSGHVYLAASRKVGILKVGMATDLENRLKNLRHRLYGGTDDWELVASIKEDSAGKLEAAIQSELKAHQTSGFYFDGDHQQSCFELFQCELKIAMEAFEKIGDPEDLRVHVDIIQFEFRVKASRQLNSDYSEGTVIDRQKSSEAVFQTQPIASSVSEGSSSSESRSEVEPDVTSNKASTESKPHETQAKAAINPNKRRMPFMILVMAIVAICAAYVFLSGR